MVALSVLPHKQQDVCMRELCLELARCMARASLQSEAELARPSSRGQRHFHSCSISQACSPSAAPQGMEMAKWLKEDVLTRQLELRRHSYSRGRDRLRWCQSSSHQHLSKCQSSSPVPHDPHPANEQLTHSMKDINLYTRPHESRSMVQWSDAPTPAEEPKKQVRFDMEGDMGDDPMLPPRPNPQLKSKMTLQALCLRNPYSCLPLRVPSATPPIQEEPGLKLLPLHLPLDPSSNPNWSQSYWIPSTTPVGGSMQKWKRLAILTGGRC